jgi:hypothetical protein
MHWCSLVKICQVIRVELSQRQKCDGHTDVTEQKSELGQGYCKHLYFQGHQYWWFDDKTQGVGSYIC